MEREPLMSLQCVSIKSVKLQESQLIITADEFSKLELMNFFVHE